MKPQENLTELIPQAIQMLNDRSKPEQDLIYYICKMEPDLRAGICIAYRLIHESKDV
jgi:hypothetical protein